jgi:phosphoribosyl-dephospho-CoA transferase
VELTVPPLPYDLVRLGPGHGAAIASAAPSWVRASLARAPWVVVRNGHAADGKLPVGIRGTTRDQRWAASAERSAIVAVLPPESIRHEASWAVFPDVAAVRALRAITASLDRDWTRWGPTGGVGFSLATGWVTVTQASDLDLLLRCPVRPARASLDALASLFARQEARVDCRVETPAGMAHLDDLRRDGPSLVRTPGGSRLCTDPWEAAAT